jgi:AbiV family abortive infection protein
MTGNSASEIEDAVFKTMAVCVDHARDLLESARAVHATGKPNIAYHLAALALEELGRRELMAIRTVKTDQPMPAEWLSKQSTDHVKKLFWAFFGGNLLYRPLTRKAFEKMQMLAHVIHSKRLSGLYVESEDGTFGVPKDAITDEECKNLIELVAARIEIASNQAQRTDISDEDKDIQQWFLTTADDPEHQRYLLSEASFAKLAELNDAKAWVKWLREQFSKAESEALSAAQNELQRSKNLPDQKTKDKWKLRVRILCDSHSIRPKVLTTWNQKSDWIKLVAVSGKKNQLIVEFILGDNVPIESLWYFGWGVARQFVVALNIGTMGFWWWRMPEQISRYYERIRDLDNNRDFNIERKPGLKIDWGQNRVFSKEDLVRVAMCFASLPGPGEREKHEAFNFYIGGITFLSLNDVHWQCEVQAYGNFHESLKAMMKGFGDWSDGTAFDIQFIHFLRELFPSFDEIERYQEICKRYESKNSSGLVITLKEVSFMKLFCDSYFLRAIGPAYRERLSTMNGEAIETGAPAEGSAPARAGDPAALA